MTKITKCAITEAMFIAKFKTTYKGPATRPARPPVVCATPSITAFAESFITCVNVKAIIAT